MTNGSKISVREFYEKVEELQRDTAVAAQAQSAERQEMEVRLAGLFSTGLGSIQDAMAGERRACAARFGVIEGDVIGLKVADRRWGGIVGLFAAGMAGLAAWLGQR